MRVLVGICVLVGLTNAASADPRAMMMMQGAWLQHRTEVRPIPSRPKPGLEQRTPLKRPLVLKRAPLAPKRKSRPGAGVKKQQALQLDANLKYAWSQAKQQRCTAPEKGAKTTSGCKAKSLTALVQLCQKVNPGQAKSGGCKLGLIAGLVKRVKRLAKRASNLSPLAGLLEGHSDRPVARYTAAVPGCLSEIQAGILLSPLRLGLLKPVQPRTLELLRAAKLITEREYRIVRERTGY